MTNPLLRERPDNGDGYQTPQAVLECVVERITFHNTENGYSVVKVTPAEAETKKGGGAKAKFVKDDVITVLGNFTNPVVGESLRLHGQWIKHPQYGQQFKLERYETLRPASAAAIEKYLGSGMVKGIGPAMAKRIVDKFGEEALNVIEKTPKKLTKVSGIGEKRVDMIKAAWDEQRAVREIMLFLQGHGVTPTYAVKIYRHYKERSIEVVETNPYQLATDIWGIGFKSADKIAQNIGIAPDAPERLQAGLVYVLNQEMESGGHCYLLEDDLIKKSCEILEAEPAPVERALSFLIDRELLIAETVEMLGMRDTAIYTPSIHTTEKAVADRINTLLSSPWRSRPKPAELDAIMENLTGFDMLSDEQKQAVRRSLSEPMMVLTGGPGSGKCLKGTSLVLGTDGLRQIDAHWGGIEAAPDTFRPHETDVVAKNQVAKTSHVYYGGLRDTIKITSHLGLELEGTPNHRVWAMTATGPDWVRLDALKTGDYVAIRRGDDVWGTGPLSPEVAYVLGAISGDGCQNYPDCIAITNNDLRLLNRCRETLQTHFGWGGSIIPTRKTFDLRVNNIALRRTLAEMGLHQCKSEGKVVPHIVMTASRKAVVSYLAGLIDTDGHIGKSQSGSVSFEITLKSAEMIKQVQLLLLNLGIVSRRAEKTVQYRYRDRPVEARTYWRLAVYGADVDRLMEIIPTQKAVPNQERVCNPNRDVVPLPGKIIRALFTANGKRARMEWWAWKREVAETRKPTRARLLTLLDEVGEENVPPLIRSAIKESCRACYYWDKVTTLSPSANIVYDLTVPGEASFIANGFVNHNTTTTRAIVAAFEKLEKRLQLASPTGRAAKRAAEVTGKEAKTIHRMLAFDPEKKGFKHGPGEPLELDVLVIDEASMLDLMLTHHTLRAVPDGAQILFVGDVDQLPSVGPGSVLGDLINSGRVPVTRLTQVFRQAAQSQIITNAHAINKGKMPDLLPPSAVRESQADCVFVEVEEASDMPDKLAGVVAKSLPRLGYKPDEITVLAPMQRGSVGARNLNEVLQRVLNPPRPDKAEHARGPIVFRAGDRVMQRVNNYDKNVFNGDVGLILSIDKENQLVGVQYPEGPVEYDFADMDQLVHAFSLTVHKCVAQYERVWTMGRGRVPIKDICVGDWVQTGTGEARPVIGKWNTGEKPVVRVRTQTGHSLDVSAEHPIFAALPGEAARFVCARDLSEKHAALFFDLNNGGKLNEPLIPHPIHSAHLTGETAAMYDIEVEGVHSFVAGGGFVCHNSQGSEYPACVIALHTQHYMMLQRNLVYTALTRAKKIAVFVGSKRAIQMAVKNRNTVPRNTRLAQRLQMLVDNLGPGGLPKKPGALPPTGPNAPAPPIPGRLL